ncbi:SVAGG family GlyGly-CTERM protein [Aeromonas dhakensis]|uniref:SVAGG family GlyGly-CTERM protein n=1 Tax=Aeromonas dhakensis TaxID=196024 RepID=UPI003986791B
MKMKVLFAAVAFAMTQNAMAATTIDVNVMVPKSIVDQDGAEKVFNTIHQRVSAMDEYYASQRTGITSNGTPVNLHFEVKQILVMSDTVLNANCMTGYSASNVLINEKVVGVRDSYGPDFGITAPPLWDGICTNEQDIQDLTFAAHSSGADMWISTKAGSDGKYDGMATSGGDYMVSRYDTSADTYAHEAFHLFGAVDLYNKTGAEGFCDQGGIWSGRLMCGYGDLSKNNMFGGSSAAIDQGDIYPYGPSEKYLLQNFYNNPDSPDAARTLKMPDGNLRAYYGWAKGSGAGFMPSAEVADRTFAMAVDSTTLTNDKPYIDVTITASGTDAANKRLSVELYSQSGSAVVGQHYNDGISQLVRFDPTSGQTALDAAGNPTYTVRVTARDLAFVGAKSFTIGLRSGTGANVTTKPVAITVQGVNTDNGGNGGGDNGGGGGGSTGPLSLVALAALGLARRFKKN